MDNGVILIIVSVVLYIIAYASFGIGNTAVARIYYSEVILRKKTSAQDAIAFAAGRTLSIILIPLGLLLIQVVITAILILVFYICRELGGTGLISFGVLTVPIFISVVTVFVLSVISFSLITPGLAVEESGLDAFARIIHIIKDAPISLVTRYSAFIFRDLGPAFVIYTALIIGASYAVIIAFVGLATGTAAGILSDLFGRSNTADATTVLTGVGICIFVISISFIWTVFLSVPASYANVAVTDIYLSLRTTKDPIRGPFAIIKGFFQFVGDLLSPLRGRFEDEESTTQNQRTPITPRYAVGAKLPETIWVFAIRTQTKYGPIDKAALANFLSQGVFSWDDLAYTSDGQWVALKELEELRR